MAKNLKVKEYRPSDISIFKNNDGTYGMSAVITAIAEAPKIITKPDGTTREVEERLSAQRVRVDLDASDTAKIESLLTKLLTKAAEEGLI